MGLVTKKGQITIPKRIREELGVQPGDEVVFVKYQGNFVIMNKKDFLRRVTEDLQGVEVVSEEFRESYQAHAETDG